MRSILHMLVSLPAAVNVAPKTSVAKMDTITANHRNLHFLISTLYAKCHQIHENKLEQLFLGRGAELQGWKWITIDFWTGCPEIKAAILMKF